jgi:hypothetical protein
MLALHTYRTMARCRGGFGSCRMKASDTYTHEWLGEAKLLSNHPSIARSVVDQSHRTRMLPKSTRKLPTNDDNDNRKHAIPAGFSFVTSHLFPAEIAQRRRRANVTATYSLMVFSLADCSLSHHKNFSCVL